MCRVSAVSAAPPGLCHLLLSTSTRKTAASTTGSGPARFCHSERSEESLLIFVDVTFREIPRSARNDKNNYFFAAWFDRLERDCIERIKTAACYRGSLVRQGVGSHPEASGSFLKCELVMKG